MWIAMDSLATSFHVKISVFFFAGQSGNAGSDGCDGQPCWLMISFGDYTTQYIMNIWWDILGYTVSWGFYTVQNTNISQYYPITEGVWTLLNLFHLVPIYVYLYYLCGRIGCWIVVIWNYFFQGISSLIITKHSPKMGVWIGVTPQNCHSMEDIEVMVFIGGFLVEPMFGQTQIQLLFTSQHNDYPLVN